MSVPKKRFVDKIREAISYGRFIEAEEQKSHEAIWRKKFPKYMDNMTVFEEVGMKLQCLEALHTKNVDIHMHNIVRALNAYRVAFDSVETSYKPLAQVMLEVIAHWNEPSFAGPPSVLGVMLVEYLQRLQGTENGKSFVPKTFIVKPATVVVLLMFAIKYNDDYSPKNSEFFEFLVPYDAMMSLSLSQSGMPFTAPRFADFENGEYFLTYHKGYCAFTKYLDEHDSLAFENEKQDSGIEKAIMLYTDKINLKPMKNIHHKFALWALQKLELEVLTALDWKLDVISPIPPPIDSDSDDQVWSLKSHAKHDNFWFWKRLAQINADASAKRTNIDLVSPESAISNKHPKTDA